MRLLQVFLLPVVALAMLSCASPQDKAFEAQGKVHNERLRLVEKYQNCIEEAGGDTLKVETCDQYLKASEALN